jgi:hypothetical protein
MRVSRCPTDSHAAILSDHLPFSGTADVCFAANVYFSASAVELAIIETRTFFWYKTFTQMIQILSIRATAAFKRWFSKWTCLAQTRAGHGASPQVISEDLSIRALYFKSAVSFSTIPRAIYTMAVSTSSLRNLTSILDSVIYIKGIITSTL